MAGTWRGRRISCGGCRAATAAPSRGASPSSGLVTTSGRGRNSSIRATAGPTSRSAWARTTAPSRTIRAGSYATVSVERARAFRIATVSRNRRAAGSPARAASKIASAVAYAGSPLSFSTA